MMKRAFASSSLIALLSSPAFGQSAEAKPAFDIADVHVSPRSVWVSMVANNLQGGFLRGDRYELNHATMLDLVRTAYGVDADKVFGGPTWLEYDKFEVSAKTKPGTKPETLRFMLQSLLEDRFRLVVKTDTQPMPAYLLTKGKPKPELKTAEGAGGGCTSGIQAGADLIVGTLQCRNVTMEAFAAGLRRLSAATFGNFPVVDQTGIEGTYDIDLQYPLIPVNGPQSPANGGGLVGAVEKLGLKLEKGTAPQPVLRVVSVNETPTPNPAGIETSLPPLAPARFEVASIRPCDQTGPNISPRFETSGRVTMRCMCPSILINRVFGLAPFEEPVGKPKWMGNNSQPAYTMEAKAPADAIPSGVTGPQQQAIIDEMLRGLLEERWGLKTHWEQRPMDALTLVAAKPKLTKAAPEGRTACTRQPVPGPGLMISLACKNMTMAQLAEQIRGLNSQTFYPVEDGTHLEGAWDFTLTYSVQAGLPALGRAGDAAGTGPRTDASEPSTLLTFNEALDKQLGLKFETHKRPEPVLVIDHIDDKPSDN